MFLFSLILHFVSKIRVEIWLTNLKRLDLLEKYQTDPKILSNKTICSDHFQMSNYKPPKFKYLKTDAVPKEVELKSPPKEDVLEKSLQDYIAKNSIPEHKKPRLYIGREVSTQYIFRPYVEEENCDEN